MDTNFCEGSHHMAWFPMGIARSLSKFIVDNKYTNTLPRVTTANLFALLLHRLKYSTNIGQTRHEISGVNITRRIPRTRLFR